ncbi:MAG: hypothetical protein GY861_17290 [bacterium]|nr:hypothetical protein [bacterium]
MSRHYLQKLNIDFEPENKEKVIEIFKKHITECFEIETDEEGYLEIIFEGNISDWTELKKVATEINYMEYVCNDDECFSWNQEDDPYDPEEED